MPKVTEDLQHKKTNISKSTKKNSTKSKELSSTSKKNGSYVKEKSKKTSSKTSSKKSSIKTSNTKKAIKSNSSSISKRATKKAVFLSEYYDLPYRYNQTIVKILAQTPKTLFVYWDISDDDRKRLEDQFGNDFFSKTKPVLIIHNIDKDYTFEVDINDFANSWYLHINDADNKYAIELGRRPFTTDDNIKTDYIHISSSNVLEAPNDHILIEKIKSPITFKNVKNNYTFKKNLGSLSLVSIGDLYKKMYQDDILSEFNNPIIKHTSSSSFLKENGGIS